MVLARVPHGTRAVALSDDGSVLDREHSPADELVLDDSELIAFVRERERADAPRWVWADTSVSYAQLLTAGLRIARCHDLRLSRAILRSSTLSASSAVAGLPRDELDEASPAAESPVSALFEIAEALPAVADPVDELRRQLAAVGESEAPGRLRLLLAAESAGALVAAEMRNAGMPWSIERHDALLTELLGPRVPYGVRPQRLEMLAAVIRDGLHAPTLNPDSPADVLRALRAAGLRVDSTRSWELKRVEHPAIPPLLEYKQLARLLTANGWTWLDAWVTPKGRFHPDYVPGGVVSGRWATRGGGALQLPKQLRSTVVADPGWTLVVADAAQLEPRVLAAMAGDLAMAEAGRGADLYAGIVASGAVPDRPSAKYGMLGAIYGATQGAGGAMMPRLKKAYPQAISLVEDAARAGERGEQVTTRLGRSSPRGAGIDGSAMENVSEARATASDADLAAADRRSGTAARDRGRFTRNFVVQGTAAEWALCWLAELRNRLVALPVPGAGRHPPRDDVWDPSRRPHLVLFLHDEVVVHTPIALAEQVRQAVIESAAAAGRIMFGTFPIDFPLDVAVVDDYGQAE